MFSYFTNRPFGILVKQLDGIFQPQAVQVSSQIGVAKLFQHTGKTVLVHSHDTRILVAPQTVVEVSFS